MCGIAGYSLASRSAVARTLGAQSLLAGIAERGADAVGYAHRGPGDEYAVVTKQRTPARSPLERISVPQEATELLVHVRDYTKGHPSISANNHPVRHRPIVGIHNGTILSDARVARAATFRCDTDYRDPVALPAVRAPQEGVSCLQRLAALAT